MIKIIVILAFLLILSSLGVALYHLVNPKDAAHSQKTAKALTFRISLSLLLFFGLFIALSLGLIKPHGLGVNLKTHDIQRTQTKP